MVAEHEGPRRERKITIDAQAHDETALSFIKFGIAQARRAWVGKQSIINCLPLAGFEEYLKSGK